MRFILVFMLFALVLMATVAGQPASKRNLVANLRDQRVADGCGCYFRFRGTPINADLHMFFSSIEDDEKSAWMNIDGQDVKLLLVRKIDPQGTVRVGSKSTRKYVAGDTSVSGTYTATRICRRDDESCESTDYAATFVVKKGVKTQVVKAVGGCGC